MLRFGASVGCEPDFSTAVYIAAQTNADRNALRDAATIPQYMTIVEPIYLWNSSFVSARCGIGKQNKKVRYHCFGEQYVVGSNSCPAPRALKQVDAREGNCRQIAAGWVLERSKTTCETSGQESF